MSLRTTVRSRRYRVDRDLGSTPSAGTEIAEHALKQKQSAQSHVDMGMEVKSFEMMWEELLLLIPEAVVVNSSFAQWRRKHKRARKREESELMELEEQEKTENEKLLNKAVIAKEQKDRSIKLLNEYAKFISSVIGEAFHYQVRTDVPKQTSKH